MSEMFPKTDEEKLRWLTERLHNSTILLAQTNDPTRQRKWEAWVLEWARRIKQFRETGEFDASATIRKENKKVGKAKEAAQPG
jgi:hypothetical protein